MRDAKYVAEKLDCLRRSRNPKLCINRKCEYNNFDTVSWWNYCAKQLLHDAATLLERDEPIKPEIETSGGIDGVIRWNVCGACKTPIDPKDKYCRECGKRVLWK